MEIGSWSPTSFYNCTEGLQRTSAKANGQTKFYVRSFSVLSVVISPACWCRQFPFFCAIMRPSVLNSKHLHRRQVQVSQIRNRKSPMEAYCVKCKAKREIQNPQALFNARGAAYTKGTCSVCGTNVMRLGATEAHASLDRTAMVAQAKMKAG